MTKKIFFPNLDGLRFLAFIAVFLFHRYYEIHNFVKPQVIKQSYMSGLLSSLFSNGHLGVNFFFVLSGFLITFLLLYEEKINGKFNIIYYYTRRTLRIWPLYFVLIFIGFLIIPSIKLFNSDHIIESANFFYYLTFLGNFDIMQYPSVGNYNIIGILWSLGVEEQFYLSWPLLLILFSGKKRPFCFLIMIIISIIFRSLNYNDRSVINFHTLSVISDMSIGGIAAWISLNNERLIHKMFNINKLAILAIYLAGSILCLFRYQIFSTPVLIVSERLILSFFFAFIILEQNYSTNSLFKIGKCKFINYWGKYSYGLYGFHVIGIVLSINIWEYIINVNPSIFNVLVTQTLLALAFTMGFSWLSYHLYEKHFLKLKKRFSYEHL